jgi:hypothetical protein
MTLTDIALKIPEEYRREILLLNMIGQAQAVASDPSMYYLFTVWKNHVENTSDLSMECNACLVRVLDNYKQLLPVFVDLERDNQLLQAV